MVMARVECPGSFDNTGSDMSMGIYYKVAHFSCPFRIQSKNNPNQYAEALQGQRALLYRAKWLTFEYPLTPPKVQTGLFEVVYGTMKKLYKNGSVGLPFFSKVSLQAAVDRIRQLSFHVAIELIEKP